jgi:hypothetical protein
MTQESTREQLLERIAQLEAKQKTAGTGYKVSAKGGLSRYGLGRFPVTLYASQWRQIIADVENGTLKMELEKNHGQLAEKVSKE